MEELVEMCGVGHELWRQPVLRQGTGKLNEINGRANPADLFTKDLTRNDDQGQEMEVPITDPSFDAS